tara:strand:+ start:269 stop:427 length:159 start_codon:yes stop_codon:yes gene_type:complete
MYEDKKMWTVETYNKKHYELEICEVFSTKLNAMKFAESVDEKLYDKIWIRPA